MPRIDLQEVRQRLDANSRQPNVLSKQDSQQQSDRLEIPTDHPLWDLWRHLSEFYGAAFTSQYGDEPNVTWAGMLRELTPAQYAQGIELLKHRDQSFPPNPAEFLALIGNDKTWERRCHKPFDESRALENKTAKEAARQAGADALAEMRRTLEL